MKVSFTNATLVSDPEAMCQAINHNNEQMAKALRLLNRNDAMLAVGILGLCGALYFVLKEVDSKINVLDKKIKELGEEEDKE